MPNINDYTPPVLDEQPTIINFDHPDDEAGKTRADKKFKSRTYNQFVSFSERLCDCEWDTALPNIDKFKNHIDDSTQDHSKHISITKNVIGFTVSLLFIVLFITELIRFIFYISDEEMREKHHVTNHIRSGIRALSFAIAFILNINNNLTGLWQIRYKYKKEVKSAKTLADDYNDIREDIIGKHSLQYVFFVILELIPKIKSYIIDEHYPARIKEVEEILKKKFKLIALKKSVQELTRSNGNLLTNDCVILNLKSLLISESFDHVFQQIKLAISKNFDDITLVSLASTMLPKLNNNYNSLISRDKSTQFIILDLISEIAIKKHSGKSRLYSQIKLTKTRMASKLKEILIKYWNNSESGDLIEPSEINFDALAIKVNYQMRIEYPHIFLDSPNNPPVTPHLISYNLFPLPPEQSGHNSGFNHRARFK